MVEFVTDKNPREPPKNPRPAYLAPLGDPLFGTKIIRITNPLHPIGNGIDGDWRILSRHRYSLFQPWNADGTLIRMDKGYQGSGDVYLDGKTYEPLFVKREPGYEGRWHPTDPAIRIWVGGDEIGTWNVRTDETVVFKSVFGVNDIRMNKGNMSHNAVWVGFSGNSGKIAQACNLQTGELSEAIDTSDLSVSWAGVSPLGKYIVVQRDSSDRFVVFDRETGKEVWRTTEYGRPSHYDLALYDGDEYAVGVSKSAPDDGLVIRRRLSDGQVTVLTDGGYASHTSCRNVRNPSWCYVSYNDEPRYPPYRLEVVAVAMDGSKEARRLCSTHRHRASYEGVDRYYTETHACPDWDGTKVIWCSNWDGENPVACYVTELGEVQDPQPQPEPEPQPQPQPEPEDQPATKHDWRLVWDPVSDATEYEVIMSQGEQSEEHKVTKETQVKISEFFITQDFVGERTFRLRCWDKIGRVSKWSDELTVTFAGPNTPKNFRLEPAEVFSRETQSE